MNYIFLKLITILLFTLCCRSRFVFSESLQEPPAGVGVVFMWSGSLQSPTSLFKRLLCHTLTIYHFIYKTALKGQITHYKGIYKARNTSGIKGKRTTNGTQNAQSRGKPTKNHINFMAFIPLFQPQKPLGCVSIFEK